MALTVREKKLVVLWRAERAVTDYLLKHYVNVYAVTSAVETNRTYKENLGLLNFSEVEMAEMRALDKQIPKE